MQILTAINYRNFCGIDQWTFFVKSFFFYIAWRIIIASFITLQDEKRHRIVRENQWDRIIVLRFPPSVSSPLIHRAFIANAFVLQAWRA